MKTRRPFVWFATSLLAAGLQASVPPGLSITLDSENQIHLQCGAAQFAGFFLWQSTDLVHWSDTGLRLHPDQMSVNLGPPVQSTLYFKTEPDLSLSLIQQAADATTIQLKWPPRPEATLYRIFRDGVMVGATAGRTGHYLDTGLSPAHVHSYQLIALDTAGQIVGSSPVSAFSTATTSTMRTHYAVLALAFYPAGSDRSGLSHIRTYLKHRLDFIRQASANSAILRPYGGDVIVVPALPPLPAGGGQLVDYATMVTTPYAELGSYSIVDLVEKGDLDAVWVVASPEGYSFNENTLVGSRDLNPNPTGEKWHPVPVDCSRSFFVNAYLPDARSWDAYAHMVEGIFSVMADGATSNWPRQYPYDVLTKNRADLTTTTPANLNLFERFRLADAWNGMSYLAYASQGHGNCGSSHFPPNTRRDSPASEDYAYYDIATWRNYIDCAADDWLRYPAITGATRKLNGYDFDACNRYTEGDPVYGPSFGASPELHPSFSFSTASYHRWWFSHLPHNPGQAEGKLNNWWAYVYDFNRFSGNALGWPVLGMPEIPASFPPAEGEYGTELATAENLAYFSSFGDFGAAGKVSAIARADDPAHVYHGQYSMKVVVDQESFHYLGRNDVFYPLTRNAGWDLAGVLAVNLSIKLGLRPELFTGVNPVIRLCANAGNRLELVPISEGIYRNLFHNDSLKDANDWFHFSAPLGGSPNWEVNVIGYIDPGLSPAGVVAARAQLKQQILSQVNYVEISLHTDGERGDQVSYYLDDLELTR